MKQERVDAKTFLNALGKKSTAAGSHKTWGGWEPDVCCYCEERVTLEQNGGSNYNHATGEATSWHTECKEGARSEHSRS